MNHTETTQTASARPEAAQCKLRRFTCESCRSFYFLSLSDEELTGFLDAQAYGGLGLNCEACENFEF
jgi:hypothetical protein